MKQKFENVKEWIRDHKRRTVGIVIAFLLVIGAGVFGVVGLNNVNAQLGAEKAEETKTVKTAKTEKSETKKETDKKAEEGEQKKEAEDEKVDSTKSTEAQSENTAGQNTGTATTSGTAAGTSNPVSGGGSQTTTSGTNQPASTTPVQPSIPVEPEQPVHEHVYDIPIWGSEPEVVMQEVTRCSGCGRKLTEIAMTEKLDDHSYNHMINGENGGSYTRGEAVETGNMIPVIIGYKCSCGAVQ